MKYSLCLLVTLLLVGIAARARAQVPPPAPRIIAPVVMVDPPPALRPAAARGVFEAILAFLTPRVDDSVRVEKDKDTWARLSRLSIPDKHADNEYMLKGILTTAVLSAGAVGLGLWDTSSYRAPRVAVKGCRSGVTIGIQGEF